MDWLNILIQFAIPALGALVAYYLIPFLKSKNLYTYVTIGVLAAEQIFGGQTGEQKFAYVKEWVQKKFKVSDEDLKNLIEAAVQELNRLKEKSKE